MTVPSDHPGDALYLALTKLLLRSNRATTIRKYSLGASVGGPA